MAGRFQPNYYRGRGENDISKQLQSEGLAFSRVVEPAGREYPPHQNDTDMLLVFVDGEARITIGSSSYTCTIGDRLLIPGDVSHSAAVGPVGCIYYLARIPIHGS
jgi:mannose-6-phosphate isomerase-like protein (cupin superfamily)